ncbi:AraC family transcriptional regulator [Nevskia ramosa]|uniref:AraC family transcriptional regulator n=2 Tax=Nevskia ramosa TaxID=64002 RepID=UPI0003B3091F|nr:AraC family transcriptional regulator [Nevskia ramosa]
MSEDTSIRHPMAIGQVMVNFAARYGVDVETCLMGTGIREAQLHEADVLIERHQEMRLIENLILALPEVPALGFELGLQYNVSTFGIWGFALRISRTLHEAFDFAIRYLPLSTAYCRFATWSDAEEFAVSADPDAIPQHLRQFLLERDTATGIHLFRELGLSGIPIKRIEYQGRAPDHAARIESLCGVAPRYGCPRNAIVLRRQDAEMLLPMYDPHLVRLLEDQCRAQLERRQVAGVAGQVRQLILGPLGLVASIEAVAQQLAMAPRSLRRRLEEEKTSFRDLVDTERRQLAVQLLTGTEMKLDEMALQLGYSDTASFTRAFRRWFDRAPGEYRKARGR